ncbi:MAG: S24/S26 family peptidase [Chitinivibrionales bacterium]
MSRGALPGVKPVLVDAIKTFFFEDKTRQCMVYGLSMEPFLSFGETVVIVQCDGPLKKGHCYAFITGNTLTIHRFIKKSGDDYALFAGDNNLFYNRVSLTNIVGELSPCQSPCAVFIIAFINSAFCTLMRFFSEEILIHRIRRRIIRSITGTAKKERST